MEEAPATPPALATTPLSTEYVWPRALLLGVAVMYGTNIPVGRMMNAALPASATTSGRFALAAVALSPNLPNLRRDLVLPTLLCGLADSIGYCAQSVALIDTPASKVSFLGALTVVVVPVLSAAFSGRRLSFEAAPQVWLAALLTLVGVGFLEFGGGSADALGTLSAGDGWAVVQSVGFGSCFWLMGDMLADGGGDASELDAADQTLPITATICATVAALSAVWALCDGLGLGPFGATSTAGWLLDEASRSAFALPGILFGPMGAAALWTGFATTAATRVGETTALSKVDAVTGQTITATEPLWAAAFGVALCGEVLESSALVGGSLVVVACLVSAAEPAAVARILGMGQHSEDVSIRSD